MLWHSSILPDEYVVKNLLLSDLRVIYFSPGSMESTVCPYLVSLLVEGSSVYFVEIETKSL